jgi:hypothetical protein
VQGACILPESSKPARCHGWDGAITFVGLVITLAFLAVSISGLAQAGPPEIIAISPVALKARELKSQGEILQA